MKKTSHKGRVFEKSGKSNLYLPENVRKQVYPTTGEKIVKGAKIALPIIAGTTLLASPAMSGDTYNAVQSDGGQSMGIVKYDANAGHCLVLQGTRPWENGGVNTYDVSGKIALPDWKYVDGAEAEFAATYRGSKLQGLTGGLMLDVNDHLKARLGMLEKLTADGTRVGGFAGGKLSLGRLAIDAEGWNVGADGANVHGYVEGTMPLGEDHEGYMSVGGSTSDNDLNVVAGAYSDGGLGVYTFTRADLEENNQSGRVIVVPKGNSRLVGGFRFKTDLFNETQMRGEVAANSIIGWPPYPAQMASPDKGGNIAFVGNWSNSDSEFNGDLGAWYLPNGNLIVGLTGGLSHDKLTGENGKTISLDIYNNFGPFGAALNGTQNLETGETSTWAYLEKCISF